MLDKLTFPLSSPRADYTFELNENTQEVSSMKKKNIFFCFNPNQSLKPFTFWYCSLLLSAGSSGI